MESRAKKMNRLIFRVLNKTQPPVDDGVQEYTVYTAMPRAEDMGMEHGNRYYTPGGDSKIAEETGTCDKMIICMYLSWLGIDVRVYM